MIDNNNNFMNDVHEAKHGCEKIENSWYNEDMSELLKIEPM